MTEQPTGPKRPAGPRNWPWMIVSLAVVVGFFAWLATSSQQAVVAVVEDVDEVNLDEVASMPPVSLEEIVEQIDSYLNRAVRIVDVQVVSRLGTQMFWTTLDNGLPFLIKAPEGTEITPQSVVEVIGVVYARDDTVLATWEASGVITDEGQRMEAEFATWYLDASEVRAADVEAGS
mgnify:CR=1 FL=1